MKIRILLVDEHTLLRVGLRMLLATEPDMEVVGEAADGGVAAGQIAGLLPNIVLTGIETPGLNGLELTRHVRLHHPKTRVLAVSMHSAVRRVLDLLDAGAAGYVHKGARYEEVVRAIREVNRGRTYLCPRLAAAVVRARDASGRLAPREREIVRLLTHGHRSPQIATKLGISEHTVETHRRNILRKLDLHGIAELIRYAIREGLAPPDD